MNDQEVTREDIRRLVGGLPDSRPRDQRGQIRTPAGTATPVYCANCHRQFGFAFVCTDYIFYLCNDCEAVGGTLPLPTVDEDYVRGRAKQGGAQFSANPLPFSMPRVVDSDTEIQS